MAEATPGSGDPWPPRPDLLAEAAAANAPLTPEEHHIELREEQLVPHTELRELGEVIIRTELEEFPGRLELQAYREEVEVEHVPVGTAVTERQEPWEEDGVMVVPVYEEQLVVVKRLVMREQIRIRRAGVTETRLIEDMLRRDRLVIEDPAETGAVREQHPTGEAQEEGPDTEPTSAENAGLMERVVRRVIS